MNNNNVSLLNIVVKADGIYAPKAKMNSWKAMSNSKIELFNYDKMILLSEIEETDKGIRFREKSIINFIFNNTNETSKTKKELLKFYVSDLISASIFLQGEIERALKE